MEVVLEFFPRPYPNEFLYSIFARYHHRAGNLAYKDTTEELLGSTTAGALTLFPSNLEYLCGQLHKGSLITPALLIQNHTFFPLFRPFLSEQRSALALNYLEGSNLGQQRRSQKGFIRFNSLTGGTFKFCSSCVAADRKVYGEPYWHRDHQLPGVFYCYEHGRILSDTGLPLTSTRNKKELYLLDEETPWVERTFQPTQIEAGHLQYITAAVHWLLNNPVPGNSASMLNLRYEAKLLEQSLAKVLTPAQVKENGAFKLRLSHRKITKAFDTCFSRTLLGQLPESLHVAPRSNWAVGFLKDSCKEINPLRHILISRLLQENIWSMFDRSEKGPSKEGGD